MTVSEQPPQPCGFTPTEQEVFYRVLASRRDIRHFRPDPIPDEVLGRILAAARMAPSVGHSQPWRFILIRDLSTRTAIRNSYLAINAQQAAQVEAIDSNRAGLYKQLKLEGLVDSPLNIAVICDRTSHDAFVLGRGPHLETDVFSTCLAVQNLWLAARLEGIGVGWVSLVDRQQISSLLRLPDGAELVAYLCVGYPVEFYPEPMLEMVGWKERLPDDQTVYFEHYGEQSGEDSPAP